MTLADEVAALHQELHAKICELVGVTNRAYHSKEWYRISDERHVLLDKLTDLARRVRNLQVEYEYLQRGARA